MTAQGFTMNVSFVNNGDSSEVGIHYNDTEGLDINCEQEGAEPEEVISAALHSFCTKLIAKALQDDLEEDQKSVAEEENEESGEFASWDEERESLLEDLYKVSMQNESLKSQLKDREEESLYWRDTYMKTANKLGEEIRQWKEAYIDACQKVNELEIETDELKDELDTMDKLEYILMYL